MSTGTGRPGSGGKMSLNRVIRLSSRQDLRSLVSASTGYATNIWAVQKVNSENHDQTAQMHSLTTYKPGSREKRHYLPLARSGTRPDLGNLFSVSTKYAHNIWTVWSVNNEEIDQMEHVHSLSIFEPVSRKKHIIP